MIKKRDIIIGFIIVLLIVSNSYLFVENKILKENFGDEVSDLKDIVINIIPKDIIEILEKEENISDEDFKIIEGEFRVAIVFYWLSNGIPEIE